MDFLKRLSTGGDTSKHQSVAQKAFTEELSQGQISFFNTTAKRPFSEQAIEFLNAYWDEVGDQAPFIFEVAWETMKQADMHTKGISYIHLYKESADVDFNVALYFYEKLCQKIFDTPQGKKWRDDPVFGPSLPEQKTAIVRKQELRDYVDVNFDGRMSFLEYLLYQYRSITSPAEFVARQMSSSGSEPEDVKNARIALNNVNQAIREYEEKKRKLKEGASQPGVKGLKFKTELNELTNSPIAEKLAHAMIDAEAKVRLAVKASRAKMKQDAPGGPNAGAIWWLNRDLEEKKRLYGRK